MGYVTYTTINSGWEISTILLCSYTVGYVTYPVRGHIQTILKKLNVIATLTLLPPLLASCITHSLFIYDEGRQVSSRHSDLTPVLLSLPTHIHCVSDNSSQHYVHIEIWDPLLHNQLQLQLLTSWPYRPPPPLAS